MREINLTGGKVAIVDDQDLEWLSRWKWYCDKDGYAVRRRSDKGVYRSTFMHRVIMQTPADLQTDHINGDRLDNRRCNLRVCTNMENQQNIRKRNPRGGMRPSQYKGVSWDKRKGKWRVVITVNGRPTHMGSFAQEEAAAKAYDDAAKQFFGDFAKLNDI